MLAACVALHNQTGYSSSLYISCKDMVLDILGNESISSSPKLRIGLFSCLSKLAVALDASSRQALFTTVLRKHFDKDLDTDLHAAVGKMLAKVITNGQSAAE